MQQAGSGWLAGSGRLALAGWLAYRPLSRTQLARCSPTHPYHPLPPQPGLHVPLVSRPAGEHARHVPVPLQRDPLPSPHQWLYADAWHRGSLATVLLPKLAVPRSAEEYAQRLPTLEH